MLQYQSRVLGSKLLGTHGRLNFSSYRSRSNVPGIPGDLVVKSNMDQGIQEWTKENLWMTSFKKFEVVMVSLGRPCHFKLFKGYLPQILPGPFFSTLTHLSICPGTVV